MRVAEQADAAGGLRRHKLQPSLVYAFSDMFSLQVGVFSVVAGRNVGRERGALISLWYKL
jgi:long-subunit fatty acid transport protein